eukprot:TRINITY_DN178_c0_g1_i6.p1 TRINITY_DN178_c0_g1~~TRINITY_DN178_c0_g1_i6.p1  ORF type:complete len:154 (+),score=25.24 TRINITY_DN178_c0_g1_i6:27-464(+)
MGSQTCVDPTPLYSSQNDWKCVCQPPSSATNVGALADCSFDECTLHETTCTNAGQTCDDPDLANQDTWRCACASPTTGVATAAAANCTIDECTETCATCAMTTCSSASQTCNDPDTSSKSVSDWVCTCPTPSTGSADLATQDTWR